MENISILKVWLMMVIAGALIFSCSSIPEKEINEARIAIREAEMVNANKYSQEELNGAKDHFTTATNLVEKDNDKARENAITAKGMGDAAYYKALMEFIASQNETTKKSQEEAIASHADKVVPEKYQEADSLYGEVKINFEKLRIRSEQLKMEQDKGKKE